MSDEYGFELTDMEREFSFQYEDEDGHSRRSVIDLAIFKPGKGHDKVNLDRVCIVCDNKVAVEDKKKGVEASLHSILEYSECEFGLWTNGDDLHFCQRTEDEIGNVHLNDISDFPGVNESIEDLERQGERAKPRKPANDSLVKTFKRCHDYIYGNEGKKKTAFWELLNMIFCKIYDEKRRYLDATEQLQQKKQAIAQAEHHIQALGQQTKVASQSLRSNYDSVIKAALYDSLISDFQKKAPMLRADKELFDDTVLQDFSEDGKNLFTCTLLLMTGMIDKATDFAQTHGGGGGSGSKLPWRGRDKDEDDIAWARRCAMHARSMLKPPSGTKRKR